MSQIYRALLLKQMNVEFDGNSFNGPNLIKTLDAIEFSSLSDTSTYEGYSMLGIVLHIIFWKIAFAKGIGGTSTVAFDYEGDNWPKPPSPLSPATWDHLIAMLKQSHVEQIAAIKALPSDALGQKMTWGCTHGEAITWIATHDTYHNAQIRNMGLPPMNFQNHP